MKLTSESEISLDNVAKVVLGENHNGERTFSQIRSVEDPDGKGHDLRLTCTVCGTSLTCRCSKPKREFLGICDECAAGTDNADVKTANVVTGQKIPSPFDEVSENPWAWKSQTNRDMSSHTLVGIANEIDYTLGRPSDPPDEATVRNMALEYANNSVAKHPARDFGEKSNSMRIAIVDAITLEYFRGKAVDRNWKLKLKLTGTPSWESHSNTAKQASVFVLDDDQDRIDLFKRAFGSENVVTTRKVSEALDLLRTQKFAKIFLDRDLSSTTETGEDVAWQMEREALCRTTPVVIHSENTRGQRVMSRYIGRYHTDVTINAFCHLKKELDDMAIKRMAQNDDQRL